MGTTLMYQGELQASIPFMYFVSSMDTVQAILEQATWDFHTDYQDISFGITWLVAPTDSSF